MGSFRSVLVAFLCFVSLCQLIPSHAREQQIKTSASHFINVEVSSLLPQQDATCKPSVRGKRQGVSLEVVHRHGPCSKLHTRSKDSSTLELDHWGILQVDQERVDSIHAQLSSNSDMGGKEDLLESKSATLPAKSGLSIGSANYIVSVGLGTPKKDLSLVFDTGSNLAWTQCKPCVGSCYKQVDPIFDPATSSSYANVSCNSPICDLATQGGSRPVCPSSTPTCLYGIKYGDGSFTIGFLATERLTLTSTEYIDGFIFGCGENNQGLFRGSAGLIGLGRGKVSLVSQAAAKYGKYFTYCLPSRFSSTGTGHLTLGKDGTLAAQFSYTPLLTNSKRPSFYFIDLQYISVGGHQLSISPTVFFSAGTIIDSGTVITRLPPQAYSALKSAFKQYMSKYPSAPALPVLDTCYDFTNYQTISVPKVSLTFGGGAVMDLPISGILYIVKISQVCLAFAGNSGDTDMGILGNVQQQMFDIVYDVDGGRIGFGSNGC